MVIFNSYVSLPEGIIPQNGDGGVHPTKLDHQKGSDPSVCKSRAKP